MSFLKRLFGSGIHSTQDQTLNQEQEGSIELKPSPEPSKIEKLPQSETNGGWRNESDDLPRVSSTTDIMQAMEDLPPYDPRSVLEHYQYPYYQLLAEDSHQESAASIGIRQLLSSEDYQQAQVIKRMVRDLNFDLKIVVAPIVREKSGLARSSRNTYLSPDERERAVAISRALMSFGAKGGAKTLAALSKSLEKAGLVVDYVECVDAETLEPRNTPKKGCCLLVAAFCGKTRLIDNRVL